MQLSTVPTNENEIEIICPNCELTNWLPSGATGDNCENCGHLFETEYTCPHCDGDKKVIDDDHPDGAHYTTLKNPLLSFHIVPVAKFSGNNGRLIN